MERSWPKEWIGLHHHHHHRFDTQPCGPGAEMETSRGCPYRCSFCTTWERALDHYLTHHVDFSDIQDQRPCPLHELELATLGQR